MTHTPTDSHADTVMCLKLEFDLFAPTCTKAASVSLEKTAIEEFTAMTIDFMWTGSAQALMARAAVLL